MNSLEKWTQRTKEAIIAQKEEEIKECLQEANNITEIIFSRERLLYYLTSENEDIVLAYLIQEGWNVNGESQSRWSPLVKAIIDDNLNITKMLIDAGAVLDHTYYSRNNGPLHRACKVYDESSIPIVEMLINAGCDVNAANELGDTPLYLLASSKMPNLGIIEMFIKSKGDINARYNQGETILHVAARNLKYDIIKLLLKYGASPNVLDKDGLDPFCYCFYQTDKRIIKSKNISYKKDVLPCMELLLCHGAKVNIRNTCNFLFYTIDCPYYMKERILQYLLERGFTFDYTDDLIRCAVLEDPRLFRLLLKYTAMFVVQKKKNKGLLNFGWNDLNLVMHNYYRDCGQELIKMGKISIHENLTLFDVISVTTGQRWVMQEEYFKKFHEQVTCKTFPIYVDILISRFNKMRRRQRATMELGHILQLDPDGYFLIIDRIIEYLSEEELKILEDASSSTLYEFHQLFC